MLTIQRKLVKQLFNKAWFKTIANESKREISLGRSYLG